MAEEDMDKTSYGKESGSYGKKPWWYWLILYLIIGGLLYLAVYYLFFAGNGGY